jgi:hypothetical protein
MLPLNMWMWIEMLPWIPFLELTGTDTCAVLGTCIDSHTDSETVIDMVGLTETVGTEASKILFTTASFLLLIPSHSGHQVK